MGKKLTDELRQDLEILVAERERSFYNLLKLSTDLFSDSTWNENFFGCRRSRRLSYHVFKHFSDHFFAKLRKLNEKWALWETFTTWVEANLWESWMAFQRYVQRSSPKSKEAPHGMFVFDADLWCNSHYTDFKNCRTKQALLMSAQFNLILLVFQQKLKFIVSNEIIFFPNALAKRKQKSGNIATCKKYPLHLPLQDFPAHAFAIAMKHVNWFSCLKVLAKRTLTRLRRWWWKIVSSSVSRTQQSLTINIEDMNRDTNPQKIQIYEVR